MDWPTRMREGFALAAAARGDRGAALAEGGLAADVVQAVTEVARTLAEHEPGARRQWVRAMLATAAVPSPEQPGAAPRALALLAPCVDRALGRRWLENAPLPRAGYTPDPELLALLRRLAARAHSPRESA